MNCLKKAVSITLLSVGLLPLGLFAQATKGLKTVAIKDPQGKQVGLYTGSCALLVGVSDYTAGWPDLHAVPGEIRELETALSAKGFVVRTVLNPNERQLKDAFESFIDSYGYDEGNRLLFFFSGHGYSRKGGRKGYLVPADAPNPEKDEKGFLRKALAMEDVLTWCDPLRMLPRRGPGSGAEMF